MQEDQTKNTARKIVSLLTKITKIFNDFLLIANLFMILVISLPVKYAS